MVHKQEINNHKDYIIKGITKLADIVKTTFGANGQYVIIDNNDGKIPHVTKDGVTVAKSVKFDNPYMNMGASLVKEVAEQTLNKVGDGTTTATIIAAELCKNLNMLNGIRPVDIINKLNYFEKLIIDYINVDAIKDITDEELVSIAKISCNGDETIATMVVDIFNKIGVYGNIIIDNEPVGETEYIIKKGYNGNTGYFGKVVADSDNTDVFTYNKVDILVTNLAITEHVLYDIVKNLDTSKTIIVFGNSMDDKTISALRNLNEQLEGNIIVVKNEGFGSVRDEVIKDVALFTNANIVTSFNDSTYEKLGYAKSITISKDSLFIEDDVNNEDVNSRVDYIKNLLKDEKSGYKRERLKERLANLTGGVAVIKIGAETLSEYNELKDRVDDCICAVRAALDSGIVPGCGEQLNIIAKYCHNTDNAIDKAILDSIKYPNKYLLSNVLTITLNNKTDGKVIDLRTNEIVDPLKVGIVDPASVVVNSIKNAFSIAKIVINCGGLIYNKENED